MIKLLSFSLKRRYLNKTTIILNLLFFAIIGTAMFSDKIVNHFNHDLPLVVYYENNDTKIDIDDSEIHNITLINTSKNKSSLKSNEVILEYDDKFIITSNTTLSASEKLRLESLVSEMSLKSLYKSISAEEIETITKQVYPRLEYNTVDYQVSLSSEKQNLITIIISSIYFMMLGFSSVVANEVVYEKSSKVLEFILTSVTIKEHFISKILIGFLTIIIQTILSGIILVFWLVVRNTIDNGYGLVNMISKIGIVELSGKTFIELLSNLQIDLETLILFFCSIIFVLLGLLIIQIILVIASSFVSSIEESSSIQGPVYILLLIIYYLSLYLNSPQQLTSGVAYYLSYIPVFSMLFIPSRLLTVTTTIPSILGSLSINLIVLLLLLKVGVMIYKYGILDLNKKRKVN